MDDKPTILPLHVLYVEDEPLARWTGMRILEKIASYVTAAESCAQAEELWRKNRFDVVVCDYRLGDGMATDLVERMRAANHKESVICLSGETEEIADLRRSSLQLAAVLRKPIDSDSLRRALESASMKPSCPADAPANEDDQDGGAAARIDERIIVPVKAVVGWDGVMIVSAAPDWLDLATDSEGGLWGMIHDAWQTSEEEQIVSRQIPLLFRQIIRSASQGFSPSDVLSGLISGVSREGGTVQNRELYVVHINSGRCAVAAHRPLRWFWFVQLQDQRWVPIQAGKTESNPDGIKAVMAADTGLMDDAGIPRGMRENPPVPDLSQSIESCWRGVRGAEPERQNRRGNGALLWACAGDQPWRPFRYCRSSYPPSGIEATLVRVESCMTGCGIDPFHARRLTCCLLDMIESGDAGDVEVSWSEAGIRVAGVPAADLADLKRWADRAETSRDRVGLFFGGAVIPSETLVSMMTPRPQPSSPAVQELFETISLPCLMTHAEARKIQAQCEGKTWLALNMRATRWISGRALSVLDSLAAERSEMRQSARQNAGRLCLMNFSLVMERIFRHLGMDRRINLVKDAGYLDSQARRLTSVSERASLLDSVVGGSV